MKIERITVCNIASLAGTHSVDFTKDPLRTAGLFSISGATGAGKSTLLDALCLQKLSLRDEKILLFSQLEFDRLDRLQNA